MGKADSLTKKYMANNAVFADAFNFYIYGGKQVIKPENLKPLDTAEIGLPFGGDGKAQPVQKYRDELKYVTAMADDKAAYLVLGIENQTDISYAMPARNMLYDSLEYSRQIEKTAAEHKKSKDYSGRTTGEYLSGFYETDRLVPVITLVVYFGEKEWTAPRSIHDMLSDCDDKILSYVENYHIHLIVPAELSDEDFDKFQTDLREVLKYINCSSDADRLSDLLNNDEKFTHMDRTAAMLLNECTKSDLKIDESGEVIDMCQAIKDIRANSIAEGRAEGHAEGLIKSIKSLMETMNLSAEQAMNALKVPEAERAEYLARI